MPLPPLAFLFSAALAPRAPRSPNAANALHPSITPTICKAQPADPTLQRLIPALREWHTRTNTPTHLMPTDLHVRRCHVAEKLCLQSLIRRAGGYRRVRQSLNLSRMPTFRQISNHRRLSELAHLLEGACRRAGLPSPFISFPTRLQIREADPTLANLIEAFSPYSGYASLAAHVWSAAPAHLEKKPIARNDDDVPRPAQNEICVPSLCQPPQAKRRKSKNAVKLWGKYTKLDFLMEQVRPFQPHPNVMPPLSVLPPAISSAVQRKGGLHQFVVQNRLVEPRNYKYTARMAALLRFLADKADATSQTPASAPSDHAYLEDVKRQSEEPPRFPSVCEVAEAGMTTVVTYFGGRRSLALRLGYDKRDCPYGMFMGHFSVRLASDVLTFAEQHVPVGIDGYVAMPSVDLLRQEGRKELAHTVLFFGGESSVGRRLFLVPPAK